MRYRIGEESQTQVATDVEQANEPVKDGLVGFSVILGLIIGIIFVVAGRRAKQYWLIFWGAGLVIAGIGYFISEYFGLL